MLYREDGIGGCNESFEDRDGKAELKDLLIGNLDTISYLGSQSNSDDIERR